MATPLNRSLYELHLAVFREQDHPRLAGRFVRKLSEGLSTPTKGRATNVAEHSWHYGAHGKLMDPLKRVGHKEINRLLRSQSVPKTGDPFLSKAGPYGSAEHDIAGVDYVMSLHTTKRDITALRAVPPQDVADKRLGDEWVERGFVSTSQTAEHNKYFTDEFSTFKGGKPVAYMKISIPKGTHAYDYGAKDADRELVLDRDLRYRVTGEESTPEGHRVLLVDVVGHAV